MKISALAQLLEGRPMLTRKDLALHFSVTLMTIDRWKAAGRLPRPVYIHGPRWRPADIERWEQLHERR